MTTCSVRAFASLFAPLSASLAIEDCLFKRDIDGREISDCALRHANGNHCASSKFDRLAGKSKPSIAIRCDFIASLYIRWEADMQDEHTWLAGHIRIRLPRVAYEIERLLRQGDVGNRGVLSGCGRYRSSSSVRTGGTTSERIRVPASVRTRIHDSRERAAIHANLFPIDMNSVLARQHCNCGRNDLRAAGRA